MFELKLLALLSNFSSLRISDGSIENAREATKKMKKR
jgi:hypothetical protein|tara:strand:- start:36 stop:146 length:111 start_codon:yes stop_codon:yes gene_type:complete